MTDIIMMICSLIIAIGGAVAVIGKFIKPITKPLEQVKKDLEDMKEDRNTFKQHLSNDFTRLEKHDTLLSEMQSDNRMVLESVALLMAHAETGNSTGEVAAGRKKLERYLINR